MLENTGNLGLLKAVSIERGHWRNEEALVCLDLGSGKLVKVYRKGVKCSDRCIP